MKGKANESRALKQNIVRRLLHYVRPYGGYVAGVLFTSLLYVGFVLLGPVLYGKAIDAMIGAGEVDFAAVYRMVIGFALCVLLAFVSQKIQGNLVNVLCYRLVRDLRRDACESLPAGLLVSVGGNVCITGPRPTDGSDWIIGVQDPDGGASDYILTLALSSGSMVSSGDYQRYYTVDGVTYCHIIDPDTLMPPALWRAVTVLCPDSGKADALSTALFCLGREEGEALLEKFGAEALWIRPDGSTECTPGFEAQIEEYAN